MSNYNKATNFAVKDTLTSGDPDKVVSGAEIDNEFNAVSSAVTSKADKVAAATANNFAGLNASGNLIDSGSKASDFADASIEADVTSLQSNKANKVSSATENNFASLDSDGDLQDSGENKTSIINIAAPTGSIVIFSSTVVPEGWVECDGRELSRTTYSDLFSVIGTNFGLGDGTNTFNVPDLRGEFVRGWDNNRNVDPGRTFGSNQNFAIENITGTLTFISQTWNNGGEASGVFSKNAGFPASGTPINADVTNAGRINFDASDVVNTSFETRPRNVALKYIIKT